MIIDLLLSYAFHAKRNLAEVRDRLPVGSRLMVDSGAYTAWTKGHQVTVDEYAEYLQRNEGGWDYAISLDVIGDWKASARQTDALLAMNIPVMPVFHYGSPLSEFDRLAALSPYVCAGGMKPLAYQQKAMTGYLKMLVDRGKDRGAVIHALGVGGVNTIVKSGVYSCDSSTVSMAPLAGGIVVFDGRKVVMLRANDKEGLKRAAPRLQKYGFPTAVIMKEGKWTSGERQAMFTASLLSMCEMWDKIRTRNPIHPDGPRYYNSLTVSFMADAVAGPRWHNVVGLATNHLDGTLKRDLGPRYYNSLGRSPDVDYAMEASP